MEAFQKNGLQPTFFFYTVLQLLYHSERNRPPEMVGCAGIFTDRRSDYDDSFPFVFNETFR